MIDLQEIRRLSTEEKFELMEILWEELHDHPELIQEDEETILELRRRLADHRANPDDVMTLDEIVARMNKR